MSATIDPQLYIRSLFNGPVLAGVGATTDAGLAIDKHHIVPWDMSFDSRIAVTVEDGDTGVRYVYDNHDGFLTKRTDILMQFATYNVDKVFGYQAFADGYASLDEDFKEQLRLDIIAILWLSLSYNYHDAESRSPTTVEQVEITEVDLPDTATVLSVDRLNRAATFIAARMHTKYQTNHVTGGSPMQASMASASRAYYGMVTDRARNEAARQKSDALLKVLHWALHPLNERLLIPTVIQKTRMTVAHVPKGGPIPVALVLDDYFNVRSRTPPASTHHFYVAAAAGKHLEPMGILAFLPEPNRLEHVIQGFVMIEAYGAQLHPAARYWGLDRVSANQKLVESVCADLGYAVRKLMPASSLANSPILQKEDNLHSGWKTFIDSLRAAMDKRGSELVDEAILDTIKSRIAPAAVPNNAISRLSGLITGTTTFTDAELNAVRSGEARIEEEETPGDDDSDEE